MAVNACTVHVGAYASSAQPSAARLVFRRSFKSLRIPNSSVPSCLCGEIAFNVLLREALQSAITRLTAESVPSPRLNAETLLMFTLNCDRAHLFAHPERELTHEEQSRYDEALAQRAKGVPAQYITGHQEFWGLDLIVSPAVLIPRPETEHLIETIVPLARTMKTPIIADVGTGSGAIALALAKELPNAEIHATDISPAALEIAEANAARLQLEFRTTNAHTPNAASTFTTPICSTGFLLKHSSSWSRTRRTSVLPKKIRFNSKSASSNRAAPSSPGQPVSKSSRSSSPPPTKNSNPAAIL